MTALLRHRIARYVLATLILAAFLSLLGPFTVPLIVAALLAFALDPIVSRYPFMKKQRGPWALAFILALFVLITAPIALVAFRLIAKARVITQGGFQNTPIYASLQKLLNSGSGTVSRLAEKFDVDLQQLPDPGEYLSKGGAKVLAVTAGLFGQLPDFALAMFIFTVAFYFFLVQSLAIRKFTEDLDLLTTREVGGIVRVIQSSSYNAFVSTFVIGVLQATVVTAGAWIFGYREFLIVFVPTFFFSLIPVIGAAPMAFILAAISLAQGETGAGIGLIVTGVVAGLIDNIVKPILVNSSGEEDVHPVVALVTIIGAILVYGMPGLILGPIVTSLLIRGLPILFRKEKV